MERKLVASADDWQLNVIAEQSDVTLYEPEEGCYVVEWTNQHGNRTRSGVFTSWAAAEACFVYRVAEEDYR